MLGIILECYRDFENRVYIVHGAGAKSTSYDIVKACVTERIGKFSKQEILALCPSLGSSSVESALKKLVDEGYLVRLGSGRRTMYVRADAKEAGLHFKKGLGWKACFDEERGIYTAERSWRGFYQLCEIDKETYDKLDPTGKNGEDPDKLIGGGRVLVEADDDYYTMPYCMVKDDNYNELAPWSRAKERYERTYNEDKGNGS